MQEKDIPGSRHGGLTIGQWRLIFDSIEEAVAAEDQGGDAAVEQQALQTIGSFLQQRRRDLELYRQDLADKSQVDQVLLIEIENGGPPAEELLANLEKLKVPLQLTDLEILEIRHKLGAA